MFTFNYYYEYSWVLTLRTSVFHLPLPPLVFFKNVYHVRAYIIEELLGIPLILLTALQHVRSLLSPANTRRDNR